LQLTVVIPTYNEAENLPKLVSALFALSLPKLRILVVDDNSPDGTGQIADSIAAKQSDRFRVLHRPGKSGLGKAYIEGFQLAIEDGAEAIAQMDADFSHQPEKLVDMLAELQFYDMVMGSRYILGGSLDNHWPLWRKGLSSFGNIYARLILGLPIKDSTGGYRIWRRNTLQKMPLNRIRSNGYAFQVEMVYVAHCLGFTMHELPIYFADRTWGHSKMSFRIQIEAALRVWQMRLDYQDLSK